MTEPFNFTDGRAANDAKELLELCEQYPDAATGFLVGEDLEKWLAYIGSYDIAECAANARQADAEDRQKLENFLSKCHSLNSPEPVISAETPTDIQDNMTAPDTVDVTETEAAIVTETPLQGVSVTETPAPEAPVEEAVPPPGATPAAKSPAKPPAENLTSAGSTNSSEKPSFFQVVAKFIVKILYRNKA